MVAIHPVFHVSWVPRCSLQLYLIGEDYGSFFDIGIFLSPENDRGFLYVCLFVQLLVIYCCCKIGWIFVYVFLNEISLSCHDNVLYCL